MERCLKALDCELCRCSFPGGQLDAAAHVSNQSNIDTWHWLLAYTSLEPEPGRRLCRVGKCRSCGKLYCDSLEISADKGVDAFLACVYRLFSLSVYHHRPQLRPRDVFQEAYLKLFREADRPFVTAWLERPENQSLWQMYCN